jgi:DNA-binding response OmpR family regulator
LAARAICQDFDSADIVEIGDERALEMALRDPAAPALAVTDYTLGWTDGFAVFQRIRTAYPQCLVIVFTGVGDETLAVELLKAGVDDYVVKHGRRRLGEAVREFTSGMRQRLSASGKWVQAVSGV